MSPSERRRQCCPGEYPTGINVPYEVQPDRIVFVYNADNGFFNALNDTAHKIFSPETYQCSLCRFTYGLTGMVLPWKRFIDALPCPVVFLDRNEFKAAGGDANLPLPAVFVDIRQQREVLLSAEEINAAGDVEGLIDQVSPRLAEQFAP